MSISTGLYPKLDLLTANKLLTYLIRPYLGGTKIPKVRSSRQLNSVWWHLILVEPQYGTWIKLPF